MDVLNLTRKPFKGAQHQNGECNEEAHDHYLGDQEGHDAANHVVHGNTPHTTHHIEHGAYRRRQQTNGVVDDEQHAKVNRVDAGFPNQGHEHGRQDENRGRKVQRGAHHQNQEHQHDHQKHGIVDEGAHHLNHLGWDVGNGNEPS